MNKTAFFLMGMLAFNVWPQAVSFKTDSYHMPERTVTSSPVFARRQPEEDLYFVPTLVIESRWSEGATSFGRHLSFLIYDYGNPAFGVPGAYDTASLPIESHVNGEGGGGHMLRWWWPMNMDEDLAQECVVFEIRVSARGGMHYGANGQQDWTWSSTGARWELMYFNFDAKEKKLTKTLVVDGKKATLLEKLSQQEKLSGALYFWLDFAHLCTTPRYDKKPEERKKWLKGLKSRLAIDGWRLDGVLKDVRPGGGCGERGFDSPSSISARNPMYILEAIEKKLAEDDGEQSAEEQGAEK